MADSQAQGARVPDMDDDMLAFGVNALTGDYMVPTTDPARLAQAAAAEEQYRKVSGQEQQYHQQQQTQAQIGFLGNNFDERNLDKAGWGVIFAAGEDQAVKDALKPLLDHRNCSATLTYDPARGNSVVDWIRDNNGQPGAVDPTLIPYYLCIVGGPDKIPFEFQYGLDMEYAVGRLCFDKPEEYSQYIENVISYEKPKNKPNNRYEAVLMGATIPNDKATEAGSRHLISKLAEMLSQGEEPIPTAIYLGKEAGGGNPAYRREMTKQNIMSLLTAGNENLPALLLISTHGWAFPQPDNRQLAQQGALVCQGWQLHLQNPDASWLFTANDVPAGTDLRGLVIFSFTCFSAGTPKFSYYSRLWNPGTLTAAAPTPVANNDFVAALPKKLLAQPKGPLGFFGHIDLNWSSSFVTKTRDGNFAPNLIAYERAVRYVFDRYPLGHAIAEFNDRNRILTPEVTNLLELKITNQAVDDNVFAKRWRERNDARSFILLGDPGVTLRTKELKPI